MISSNHLHVHVFQTDVDIFFKETILYQGMNCVNHVQQTDNSHHSSVETKIPEKQEDWS